MKLALGQINPTVGDLSGNTDRMIEIAEQAAKQGGELVIFPELAVSGYPPLDLVEVPAYLRANEEEIQRLARATRNLDLDIIAGYAGRAGAEARRLAANRAAHISGGEILHTQQKMLLPTYDVFDEWRYFEPAESQDVWNIRGCRVGVTICEDVWNDKRFWDRQRYERDPVEELVAQGMDCLINISASPYHMGKRQLRTEMITAVASRHRLPVVMVNQTGGNDQLVFDGSSFVAGADGAIRAQARSFAEDLIFYDTNTDTGTGTDSGSGPGDRHAQPDDELEAVYEALVLGTGDYIRKCGFKTALLGLSGGIDSALTAVIAAEAIGAGNVTGVAMPGPYSSEGSVRDARLLAEKLGIGFEIISIQDAYGAMRRTLAPLFQGLPSDTTEENLQARLRGVTLMALSNKLGAIVLATGNKSELAVGYCTLYGDMAGGLAVISDIPKVMVYELCRLANRRHEDAIPEPVFTKPPSAELRPDQKDTDSLPDYDVLDPILRLCVERYMEPSAIAEQLDLPLELVRNITRMVERNEYKRQQAAPGPRVTSKAFGIGRRFPIAQCFSP